MAITFSGFSRLKSLFKSCINLSNYDDILKNSLNAEIGTLPKDMLAKILSGSKTVLPSDQISIAKKGFIDAIEPLSYGIEVNQRAQSISLHKIFSKFMTKEKFVSLDFLDDIDFSKLTKLAKQKEPPRLLGVEKASVELTKAFSQIIPNCSKVNVTALGNGSLGAGFKLEFLDASGKKLLHDKVLKLFFKDNMTGSAIMEKIFLISQQNFNDIFSNMTKRDIVTLFNNFKRRINSLSDDKVLEFIKPFEQELKKNNINFTPEEIKQGLQKIKELKLKDLKPLFEILEGSKQQQAGMNLEVLISAQKKLMSRCHGIAAEANTTSFLRNRLGHTLSKTNVITPDYYDLKRGYSIAEFSDDLLPISTSDIDFSSMGLLYTDPHSGNTVAGRIIDIGGVLVEDTRLQDKLTLRYFKKITNQKNQECRKQYIEKLRTQMEHMNLLDKEKIQNAINIANSKFSA